MRQDIRDILLQAKRNLDVLACIVHDDPMNKYNEYLIADNFDPNILDSLIKDVTKVQGDNSLLEVFASEYSLIDRSKGPIHPNIARVDAIWEQAVKDVQARYDELIKEKSNDTTRANQKNHHAYP